MISLVAVSTAIEQALRAAAPTLLVYPGGPPDDQQIPRDAGGAARGYAALYLAGGQTSSDRLPGLRPITDARPLHLSLPIQVTAAAGTYEGALWAVGKVRLALTGLRLIDNAQTTRLREITDPGPVRKDQDVPDDVRWYLPMQYRFTTTT